jgi:hypothetical protein
MSSRLGTRIVNALDVSSVSSYEDFKLRNTSTSSINSHFLKLIKEPGLGVATAVHFLRRTFLSGNFVY